MLTSIFGPRYARLQGTELTELTGISSSDSPPQPPRPPAHSVAVASSDLRIGRQDAVVDLCFAIMVQVSVKGMTCAACSGAVENALRGVPGVKKASVALLAEQAEVEFDAMVIKDPAVLVEAVEDAGFDGGLVSVTDPIDQRNRVGVQVLRLSVLGMTCAACSGAVERAVGAIQGVSHVSVSLTQAEAEVHFDSTRATKDLVLEAVDDAGFSPSVISCAPSEQKASSNDSISVKVTGMTCGACSSSIERKLQGTPGIREATVNHITELAEVVFDPDQIGPRNILALIKDCGFGAEACPQGGTQLVSPTVALEQELAKWSFSLRCSLLFTIPVFILAMVLPVVPGTDGFRESMIMGFPCVTLLKWILVTPVQFIIGARFYFGAWKSLRRGCANMDVLVALGTSASYFYSVISVMHHHLSDHHMTGQYIPTDFFETSAMIITLILMGKYLECAAKGKTSEAITKLLRLAPDTATVVELATDGSITSTQVVPSHLIHRGDIIQVISGERVPTDGFVLSGETYVNEAMITGEPKPVWKSAGDTLIGGTISSGSGVVLMKATRVGSETVLSQIVRLVQQAQMSKAPVQAFADHVSSVFVPVVVALSFITWLAWYVCGVTGAYPKDWLPLGHTEFLFALLFGIAVIVIACPCALGLATPTAVMVGTGVAASLGILIKGGDALERASEVDVVVFDKTGTLTLGRPSVISCNLLDEMLERAQLCRLMGAAESASDHPLARAVLEYCSSILLGQDHLADQGSDDNILELPISYLPTSSSGGVTMSSPTSLQPVGNNLHSMHSGRSYLRPHDGGHLKQHIFPMGNDVHVAQGMGITCWVEATKAGLTQMQQARFCRNAAVGSSSGQPHDNGKVTVVIGNRVMMQHEGVRLPDGLEALLVPEEVKGNTCVLIALGSHLVAIVSISDPIKPEALDVIRLLKRSNISCCMLTGDNRRTAHAVAEQLEITAVYAEVMPADKAQVVLDLQAQDKVVAMVGDGINDSPALAAADIGIAIGSGTDIAIESADYVLMKDSLIDVVTALEVSRVTLRRIRLNYFFAMVYNVVMIPVAAGVFYPAIHRQLPPWVAGACMAFSSVSVICSSLMIRRFRPQGQVTAPLLKIATDKILKNRRHNAETGELDALLEDHSQKCTAGATISFTTGGGGRGILPPALSRILGSRNQRLAGSAE